MRRTIAATGGLALVAILAVTGCQSDSREAEIDATRARIAAEQSGAATTPPAPPATPGAAQEGPNLAAFDLVFGDGDGFVGSYARTAPNTWVGPDLTNYQSVTWTAVTTPSSVELTSGAQSFNVNVSNGLVSSGSLDPALNHRIANQVFQ